MIRYGALRTLDYPNPPLGSGQLSLRAWELTDIPAVICASRDAYIPSVTTIEPSSTESAARTWIERQWSRRATGSGISLAALWESEVVGAANLLRRPEPGVLGLGYWVIESARGKGVATGVVQLLAGWALEQGTVQRIEALVEPWNMASRRVLEKAGFSPQGLRPGAITRAGTFTDGLLYSVGH